MDTQPKKGKEPHPIFDVPCKVCGFGMDRNHVDIATYTGMYHDKCWESLQAEVKKAVLEVLAEVRGIVPLYGTFRSEIEAIRKRYE